MKRQMADDPPYILDIPGLRDEGAEPSTGGQPRRWIGIHFECCGVYTRIYVNRDRTAYEGCCPKCLRAVRVKIGPGGTSNRIFRAK